MDKKPTIKHVIFDWSGTIYDDHRPSYLATKKIIKRLSGHNITYPEYKENFTLPVISFYQRYGIQNSLDELNQIYFDIYDEHYHEGKMFDGVLQTLKLLKKEKITTSIFSTVRQNILEKLCKKNRLTSYFSHIQGSVCDKRKEMKAHLKKLKAKKTEILFIGDMDHDIEAGNLNGLLSGCIMNGYHNTKKLLQQHPRFAWRHQKDWLPFFNSLSKPTKKKSPKPYAVSTSGVLIFNQNQEVLLVLTHKWSYTYGIPGGKIEKGETAAEAAKREILEETGLEIRVKDLVLVQDCINSDEFYIPQSHFLLFNYLGKTNSQKVRLNSEALSYLWIKPRLALNLRLNKPTRLLIEKYLQSLL